MSRWLIILAAFMISGLGFADSRVVNTKIKNSHVENSTVATTSLKLAKQWNLTESEWARYQELMRGPSGHYYSQLTPPEVLGIQADDVEDLRHYAEISAELEHDKLTRELRFNAAFHEAAALLYASEPIIMPFDYTPFTPIPRVSPKPD